MITPEQNSLMTRGGAGTPAGRLLRMYWQPAALVDELQGPRPVRAVRLLREDLVLFHAAQGEYGLIQRYCPHRSADLAYGRLEPAGLRCLFRAGCSMLADNASKCRPSPPAAPSVVRSGRAP